MTGVVDARPSPIAGQWYPADPQQLRKLDEGFINEARLPEISGEVIAVMAPHAGHLYSGAVAGYAFAALKGKKPEVVAVVSPMHQLYYQPLLTSAHDAYETPLGLVEIDRDAVTSLSRRLQTKIGVELTPVRNDPEHSLEIELPYLQVALDSNFKLIPVMLRDQSLQVTRALGEALAEELRGRDAVIVASSDLSHFYPQEIARVFDLEILRRVEAFDPQSVLSAEEDGEGFACGKGAVASMLWAARGLGANRVRVLQYATSGDVTGDFSRVVGYGAAVVYKSQ